MCVFIKLEKGNCAWAFGCLDTREVGMGGGGVDGGYVWMDDGRG